MLFRAVALSLALLIGIGTIIPFATQEAEAGPRKSRKSRHAKKYKKYSKGWWRQYHARKRKAKSLHARKRSLRLRQLRLARENEAAKTGSDAGVAKVKSTKTAAQPKAVLPTGDAAPNGWKAGASTPSELQFRIDNSSGAQVGSASISVVGPAVGGVDTARRSVGGVSTSSLRREVIDRMIRENGWVLNDYQKDIGGQPVYVVVAQSQAKNGAVQSRVFYFTEVDGRIYSVATNSPVQETERLAEESEKVINSLKSRVRPSLRAAVNE